MLIAPSLMAADLLNLGQEVKDAEKAGADWLHIDVMDGHFVPNVTFGTDAIRQIKSATNLPLDVHLMVEKAAPFIEMYAAAGADHISIHPESTNHSRQCMMRIKELGCKVGVVLNHNVSVKVIEPVMELLDIVLIMSVRPGFSGQRFIEDSYSKVTVVKEFKETNKLNFKVVVDGGVNICNAKNLKDVGANVLVAGNSIFKAKCYKTAIAKLR